MKLIKEFKEFKEGTNNQLSEIREKNYTENKLPSDAQESTNISLVEIWEIVQDENGVQ